MSCSTNTYDCLWEPSPFFAVVDSQPTKLAPNYFIVDVQPSLRVQRLEWCPRCRLVRIPEEARP